jgi:spoIIIJ-associated protein
MECFEAEGRDLDEALQKICENLGVPKEDLDYEVLNQRKRLLGILGRESVLVKAWRRGDEADRALEFLNRTLSLSGFDCTASLAQNEVETVLITVQGPDVRELLERGGDLLDSFQFLLNRALARGGKQSKRVILDAERFRARRMEELKEMALRSAAEVRRSGKPVVLVPMNAHDRRLLHLELKDDEELFTRSLGEGSFKKVMIGSKRTQRGQARIQRRHEP